MFVRFRETARRLQASLVATRRCRGRFQRPPQRRWRAVILGTCGLIGLAVVDPTLSAETVFDAA